MLAMEAGSRQGEKQVTSGQIFTHTQHKTISSKTHLLILAMEGADKRETSYFWSNIHKYTTPSSKTHTLMLAMERATRKETGYFWPNVHTYTTQDHSIKLTL